MRGANKTPKETLKSLGEAIRDIRNERKISQEKLALEAEVNRTFMGRLERGRANVSVLTLSKICKVLDVSIAEVLFRGKV